MKLVNCEKMKLDSQIQSTLRNLFLFPLFSFLYLLANPHGLFGETYLATPPFKGEAGDVVQIPIFFETNESIVGADIVLHYDETVLQLGEMAAGNSVSNHDIYDDQATDGELKITILSMTNDVLQDGNLSLLSFLLLEDIVEETQAVTVDVDQSMFIAASTDPFVVSPILPISDLNLSFPLDPNGDTFAKDREILFSINTDGSLASYSWSMGDNSSLIEGNSSVLYSYNAPGTYLVTVYANNLLGSYEKSFEISVDEPFWQFDAEELGMGWKSFDWFGEYYPVTGSNWMFHINLGWLYRAGDTIDSTWLWSENWGWGWISRETYPHFFLSSEDWIYYFKGTSDPIRYYDFGLLKWIEVDKSHRITVNLSSADNSQGTAMGPSTFYHGDSAVFVAKPKPGYLFAGWKGSVESGKNPLFINKPTEEISLVAHFTSIKEIIQGGTSSLNLDHLDSVTQQKAIAEILLLGSSSYITSGDAPEFDLKNMASNPAGSSTVFDTPNHSWGSSTGIFGDQSHTISHPFFPLPEDLKQVELLENNSKYLGTVESNGTALVDSINCSILQIKSSKDRQEKRWVAQDLSGNVWLIQSEVNGVKYQQRPTLLLPSTIKTGISSLPPMHAMPTDFSAIVDYPFSIRPFNAKVAENCLSLRLNRTDLGEQLEVYSHGKGLVKISW